MDDTLIAIIGAGPYGLSLAAHLRAAAVPHRIFGHPMQPWADNMPPGMLLKSDVPSSNLSDPARSGYPLERFQIERDIPSARRGPIPVEQFTEYGRAFQQHSVPHLEQTDVVGVQADGTGYRLTLSSGEAFRASKVVVAVGVRAFSYIPPVLRSLPDTHLSHSSAYGPVESLAGREVAVVGAGASAIDLAAALHENGVHVTVVARRGQILFNAPRPGKSLWQRLRNPDTAIGGGWRLKFCAEAPGLFHLLPQALRRRIVAKYLGPSPGWFMQERVVDIPILTGATPVQAEMVNDRVELTLATPNGARRQVIAEHVIAATGYKIEVDRLAFLDSGLAHRIHTTDGAPTLSRRFESSVAGLYFIGPAAALAFGPVMRFVHGAHFAAQQVAGHLAAADPVRPRAVKVPKETGMFGGHIASRDPIYRG